MFDYVGVNDCIASPPSKKKLLPLRFSQLEFEYTYNLNFKSYYFFDLIHKTLYYINIKYTIFYFVFRGLMKIAEVESRFDNINTFIDSLAKYGFEKTKVDQTIEMFVFMDFKKTQDISKTALKKKLPVLELKPCIYKKR